MFSDVFANIYLIIFLKSIWRSLTITVQRIWNGHWTPSFCCFMCIYNFFYSCFSKIGAELGAYLCKGIQTLNIQDIGLCSSGFQGAQKEIKGELMLTYINIRFEWQMKFFRFCDYFFKIITDIPFTATIEVGMKLETFCQSSFHLLQSLLESMRDITSCLWNLYQSFAQAWRLQKVNNFSVIYIQMKLEYMVCLYLGVLPYVLIG